MMRYGSLFSGIGGLDLGLDRAGMTCAWQVEYDEWCRKVLEKHWPGVPKHADVCEVTGLADTDIGGRSLKWERGVRENRNPQSGSDPNGCSGSGIGATHILQPVDLLCGGFPCQPHSVAGKRKGADDERNLWGEFLRLIRELQPRWVLGENVPGIDSTMLAAVCADLEGEGYQVTVLGIPAGAVGAPHRRERRFIVAHTTSIGCTGDGGGREAGTPESGSGPRASAVGDSEQPGLQGRTGERMSGARGASEQPTITSRRLTEPCMGGEVDGVSAGLHGPWLGDWEGDTPRVATGIKDRANRLKALGNAVVPQVAEYVGRMIMEADTRE